MEDCTQAALVVTSLRLPKECGLRGQLGSWPIYKEGPHAIYIGPTPRIVSARALQGDRPWAYGFENF